MAQITYDDKVALNENPSIADINKVKADDMNEIKSVVNANADDVEEIQEKIVPVGAITQYAGSTAPTGWLICDGSAVSRTTYANLFSLISTTYGTGDGSTTFNVPNLKGRVPVGFNSSDESFDTLGETGGEKTHTLTVNEMPSHNHAPTNQWFVSYGTGSSWAGFGGGSLATLGLMATTGNRGGGQAHNNLQPYIVLNYIIKY